MSSIEPDRSRGEMDRGREIPGGFVVAGSDGAELFEFGTEIFDEVARFMMRWRAFYDEVARFIEFLVNGTRR